MIIDSRGYWYRGSNEKYCFDEPLCMAIIRFMEEWNIKTVLDIGCGNGAYTNVLNANGIAAVGYDGNPNTEEITNNVCKVRDFSKPVNVGTFDAVLCLEVGEHIPRMYERTFINNIALAAEKYIFMSWAVIGQGGKGHVNCRDNKYIISAIERKNFVYLHEPSLALRKACGIFWFKNTLMVFKNV